MKNIKITAALCATAILCLSFTACSKNDNDNPQEHFGFGYAGVITSATKPTIKNTDTTTAAQDKPQATTTKKAATTTKKVETTTKAPDNAPTTKVTTSVTTTVTVPVTTQVPTTKPTTTKPAETTAPTTTQLVTSPPINMQIPSNLLLSGDIKLFESEALRLINEERKKQGLSTLSYSTELTRAAETRAQEQYEMGKLSHERPDGKQWHTVSPKAMGENLAMGQTSPQEVVTAWLNSEGHRKNMLKPDLKTAGVGCYYNKSSNNYYWVLLLGL